MKLCSRSSVAVAAVSAVLFSSALLTGCGSAGSGAKDDVSSSAAAAVQKKADETYDSIYDEYSKQIEEAAPKAVEEFKKQAKGSTDVKKLAEVANDQVKTLAKIMTDGGKKMAELREKNGDSYKTYEKNYKKLYKVYSDKAMDVYGAYLDVYGKQVPGYNDQMKQQLIDQYKATVQQLAPAESE